jgi:hypothetical protein
MNATRNSSVIRKGVMTLSIRITPDMGLDAIDCEWLKQHLLDYARLTVQEIQNAKFQTEEGFKNNLCLLN